MNNIKEFLDGFRSCSSKSREFYYNFKNLKLKEVPDIDSVSTYFYFRHSGSYFTNDSPSRISTFEKYYEVDDELLKKDDNPVKNYNRVYNCLGNKIPPVYDDIDGCGTIKLKRKDNMPKIMQTRQSSPFF
jgi:hypothetical protein